MIAKSEYIPEKQDIIWLDFDPSVGREIQKRRPALVVSRREYALQTGFVAVCPITHGQQGLVDGAVNPFQLYTFDFRMRNAQKITRMDTQCFQKVVQLYQYIFGDT